MTVKVRIVEKEAFSVVGVGKRVTTVDGKNMEIIPVFWREVMENGTFNQLFQNSGPLGVMGICMEYEREHQQFTYMIAIEKSIGDVPENFVEKEIPASTWAVFESIGPIPEAIQGVWKRIFSEWFPNSGYKHAGTPELEIYLPGNPDDKEYRSEVWIPVLKDSKRGLIL